MPWGLSNACSQTAPYQVNGVEIWRIMQARSSSGSRPNRSVLLSRGLSGTGEPTKCFIKTWDARLWDKETKQYGHASESISKYEDGLNGQNKHNSSLNVQVRWLKLETCRNVSKEGAESNQSPSKHNLIHGTWIEMTSRFTSSCLYLPNPSVPLPQGLLQQMRVEGQL